MRKNMILSVIVALSLVGIPLMAAIGGREFQPVVPLPPPGDPDIVRIKRADTGEVLEISEKEYIIGVIACNIPMTYEDEALKAQAVACYTYLYYMRKHGINNSPASAQGFFTVDDMKSRWGDNFENDYARLTAIVSEVFGQILTANGDPVLAAFHAISCGMTEDSINLWGEVIPCLAAVDSSHDVSAEGYRSSADFSLEEFSVIAKNEFDIDVGGTPAENIFTDIHRSPSGNVLSANVCGTTISGAAIRAAFGLRSCAFDVSAVGGRVFFAVRGYGHGLGMSQYGANEMAKAGSSYREILLHYYPGAELSYEI